MLLEDPGTHLRVELIVDVVTTGLVLDERERVRAALSQIGEAQREAIDLAFFGGLTQTQISERLGAPLGTVKARIRRGLLALREVLGGVSS